MADYWGILLFIEQAGLGKRTARRPAFKTSVDGAALESNKNIFSMLNGLA